MLEHIAEIIGAAAGAALVVFFLYGWLASGRFARAGSLAMAAGFVAGFFTAAGIPKPLTQIWVFSLVTAAIAGVVLAIANGMGIFLRVAVTLLAVIATTLVIAHKPLLPVWEYMAVIAGLQVVYLVATLQTVREPRLWLAGPAVWWLCASATAGITFAIIDATIGSLLVTMAVLAGVLVVVGIGKRARPGIRGAMGFFALQMPVLLALTYFNNPTNFETNLPSLPMSMYALLAAAPLALFVTWIPAVRKRAWVALIVSLALAVIPLAIAVVLAMHNRPPGEFG